jgi:uncharacterized protein (TIGR03437 family)
MRLGGAAAVALAACGVDGPAIDRLEPATAAHGDIVTVHGAGFCGPDRAAVGGECTSAPSGAVAFGLNPPMARAPILSWSDAAIAVQVPAAAPLGPTAVIVTVDGRSSNAATLEILP